MQNEVDTQKNGTLPDPALGVVPLLGPRPTRVWPEELGKADQNAANTLTVQHDGGVIVLSKVDAETVGHHPREDCQDILLMVELKYKDDSEVQQAAITKAPAITYTMEPQENMISKTQAQTFSASEGSKLQTVTYTNDVPPVKTHALTYTLDPQTVASSKTYTLAYTTDSQPVKTQTISYTTEAQPVTVSKIQTFSYTTDTVNKPQTVTYTTEHPIEKAQLVYTADPGQELQPVALTKSHMLSYSAAEQNAKTHLIAYATEPPASAETYSSEPAPDGTKTPTLTYTTTPLPPNTLLSIEGITDMQADASAKATLEFPAESAEVLNLNSNISQPAALVTDSDK